jgi:hypothetical protein
MELETRSGGSCRTNEYERHIEDSGLIDEENDCRGQTG